ncbi:hypothetical protein [Streptomyces fructofermentans]|uniref:Secreted protein n=1 Tax=Streptomyces fructofermentans TaxID=152141 RepID=A0A918K697_9ACTN|nr:hypothetical protein [Streptomyces fructofermentans]GGX51353.1 hypothetical protein GCM10010515_18160 [Streptomyces fructofermentans]
MVRGKTARTLFAVLAAVLLALQFSAPSTTFASAHGAHSGGPGAEAEFVACGERANPSHPGGPLRTRDRVRAGDHPPHATVRSPLRGDPADLHGDVSRVTAAAHRTTRSSTGHSTAALQVFRC